MPMPERDARAAQVADRRTQLIAVMDEAVKWFRLQLKTSAAAEARAYLAKRGLSEAAQDRWDIGFAPDGWHGLQLAMKQKGISDDLLVASGLCAKSDKGGEPYDRFRNRIIFPIRDGRGRAISLGGRAMDPKDNAKYLNGPETEIFDKGRNLYNHAPAREAAGKGKPLIVAEGYMDVIALCEAGFTAAVAPLGTAVTEDQLRLMWRIHDEPIIALDGDAAGIRAALRVVDLALPLLEAGKGLRFAVLPGGQDPDDLIKSQGPQAMQAVIEGAQPMVRLLWQRETEGRVFDSPERKATLDKSLRAALKRIADPSIRAHYGEDIKRLRLELFGQGGARVPAFRGARFVPKGTPLPASASARQSLLAQGLAVEEVLREAVILASLILHPGLIHRFESALERLDLTGEDHNRLRALLLAHADENPASLDDILRVEAGAALDALMRRPHVQIAPPVRNRTDVDLATLCLAEEMAKLDAHRAARREIEDAVLDLTGLADEGLTWRLSQAAEARHRADHPARDDANDMGEDRAALSSHLQALIDDRVWEKKR